jgi:hypothetical protein
MGLWLLFILQRLLICLKGPVNLLKTQNKRALITYKIAIPFLL